MKYTVRFAHLRSAPNWKAGDIINRGDIIGIMGNTGASTGAHLHIDCVEGEQKSRYTLTMIDKGNPKPNKNQLFFFIDDELFGVEPYLTTGYDDPDYFATYGKWHKAYDVVPVDRRKTGEHFVIHWNRSYPGIVSLIVDEPKGYGHCIYITFETEEK